MTTDISNLSYGALRLLVNLLQNGSRRDFQRGLPETARELVQCGLVQADGGNSIVLMPGEKERLCTPSNWCALNDVLLKKEESL